jgi:hypothetical protein
MPRRWIESLVAIVAVAALGFVLFNATLVDRRPPTVSRISLSATARDDDHLAQTLTAIDLSFSEPVDRASVEQRFRIEPYVGGTFTWDRDTTAIFTPARKLPSATQFNVFVAAGFTDAAGNPAPDAVGPFQFATVGPPVVLSMTPASGATGVATNTVVELEFDRLMDTGSVEAALAVDPAVPNRKSWSGPRLTITFPAPLNFGATYAVNLGSDAADTDGSRLAVPYNGTFTTVAAGLGVDAVLPADGVAGIGVRTPIAIMFDGPIDPASIAGAVRITPEIGGDLRVADRISDTAVPSPDASSSPSAEPASPSRVGSTLLFTPSGPLAQHTTYTVELAPIVTRAGDPGQVAAGRKWTFTTGGLTTSAQNQVAFLSDRGGIRNVWLMNPDGSNPRQITTELAPVSAYDVASDGRSLVFAAGGQVRQMPFDGSDLATLTSAGFLEYAPTLTADGGAVLVGRRDVSGEDLGWWLEPLPGGSAAGPARQVLIAGAPPPGSVELGGDGLVPGPGVGPWASRAAFDPTDHWLLLVLPDGRVAHVDLGPDEPGPSAVILGFSAPDGVPVWNGADTAFVVTGRAQAGDGLIRVEQDGRGETLLVPAVGPSSVATHGGIATLAAPTGEHIGYTSLASKGPAVLTTATDLFDRSPGFSPDGTTLLFGRVLAADPTRSAGIWLCGLDGRDLRQLSTDGSDPRWLP